MAAADGAPCGFVQLRCAALDPQRLPRGRTECRAGRHPREFGGGGRFGLGTYLLGSLGRADPPRLWGIGLTATLIAGLAYALFAIIGNRVTGSSRAVTVTTAAPPDISGAGESAAKRLAIALVAVALPLILWWLLLAALRVPEMIAKTPAGIIDYLFLGPTAASAQERLLAALVETLPITAVGLFAGLAFAFLLALLVDVFRASAACCCPSLW